MKYKEAFCQPTRSIRNSTNFLNLKFGIKGVVVSLKLKHSRGDINSLDKELENGQIFLSYVNDNPTSSDFGHSFSKGQLWAQIKRNGTDVDKPMEIANARSINSLMFKGYLNSEFNGDFLNSPDTEKNHCHEGDFWIFSETVELENPENKQEYFYKENFYKGDILFVTGTTFEKVENSKFADKLTSISYEKIPLANADALHDLTTDNLQKTLDELSYRLRYRGEFSSVEDLDKLSKQVGNTYIATKPLVLSNIRFEKGSLRDVPGKERVSLIPGDLIFYNGSKWVIIPSGQNAETLLYNPDKNKIDSITTFSEWHKEEFKNLKTTKEALDFLASTKAQLDEKGKVPFSQLPESLHNSLSLQGKFYPITSLDKLKDDPDNQNPWPDLENRFPGAYWIVDCKGKVDVRYADKENPQRILELNTGDWIVWVETTEKDGLGNIKEVKRFEVIDNSDRITSIDVTTTTDQKEHPLRGNVGIKSKDKINLEIENENDIVISGDNLVSQSAEGNGERDYLPVYTGNLNELAVSRLHQERNNLGEILKLVSEINFQIGQRWNNRNLDSFGNIGIRYNDGQGTLTTHKNNWLFFETSLLDKKNNTFFRTTNLRASERTNNLKEGENLDIILPEESALLVGILEDEVLAANYVTKTTFDGFIKDSLNSEITDEDIFPLSRSKMDALLSSEEFRDNFEEGFFNIGIGRLAAEDTETGEITFYGKSKDGLNRGFYTQFHSFNNSGSSVGTLIEHWLDRVSIRTKLVINPTVLEDAIETFVKMPTESGTLLTWAELGRVFGSPGTPLMIPAWEEMNFREGKFIGLDTSPITIRINRPKHDNVDIDRHCDLEDTFVPNPAWSYIDSNKEGSLQDKKRTSEDDIVTFDSWLEAQRAVASKEAFILPSTSTRDGESTLNERHFYEGSDEPYEEGYGKDTHGGKYQRIMPSRTLYKEEPVYFDPITGKLIKQDITTKDVEMPAVGGVLLTSRSRIEGGIWIEEEIPGRKPRTHP